MGQGRSTYPPPLTNHRRDHTTMLTVNKLLPQGRGLAAVLLRRAAEVSLDWRQRQHSHLEVTDSQGRRLEVSLPQAPPLRDADVLVAEDGSLIRVLAAPQPVLLVRACAEHGSPLDLLRAAYQLGLRQVALALEADQLMVEADPALAETLRQQHLIVTEAQLAFEPVGAAPAATGHGHGHGHGPDCAHGHDHGHDHPPH